MKHIVTVGPSVPTPSSGGGGNWGTMVLRFLIAAGYRVTHVSVYGQHGDISGYDAAVESWRKAGVEVVTVKVDRNEFDVGDRSVLARIRKLVYASPFDVFRLSEHAVRRIEGAISNCLPDAVLALAFFGTLYSHRLDVPRGAIQAEGQHVNIRTQLEFNPDIKPALSFEYLRYWLARSLDAWLAERATVKVNGSISELAYQGPHYVAWARRRGIRCVRFITTPVPEPDFGELDWKTARAKFENRSSKTRILMIGHLHSTSNKSGLPIFFHDILPALDRRLGSGNFEVQIIGRNDQMPAEFDRWRNHPALVFRGPVFPADEEFLKSNILLVPIPARTGSRVRIINGFSYGCCIVAHEANSLGLPELVDGQNILLGASGDQIAAGVGRAAADGTLRARLGEAGRKVFESYYSAEAAAPQYLQLVDDILAHTKKSS